MLSSCLDAGLISHENYERVTLLGLPFLENIGSIETMSRKTWVKAASLLGIVVVSVFLGYLIGSNVPGVGTAPASSGFLVGNLSIQPNEVQPDEVVTITVSVANTHDTWGIYSLVLNVNGVKEAETQANVDARSIEDVTFSVARGEPGRYRVFINGVSGSFIVVKPTQ